jgi:hypothetical protein
MHSEVKGPVDELVNALEALIQDTTNDIEYLENYQRTFVAEMN